MKIGNKYVIYGVIVSTILILTAFVFWPEEGGAPWFQSDGQKKERAERMARNSPPGGAGSSFDGDNGGGSLQDIDDSIPIERILEDYKEWSQYPPSSRPLSKYNEDLIRPSFIQTTAIPMADNADSKEPNGYSCQLQPLTWAVIGSQDQMRIVFDCKNPEGKRIPIEIKGSRMWREFDGEKFGTLSPDVGDNGVNGDDIAKDLLYTFQWKPTQKDWGDMILEVDFRYGPGYKKTGKLNTSFYSSPGKPAELSGAFSDTTSDGSLVVRVGINVYSAGNYHVEANLKHAETGEYIAWATFDSKLPSGYGEAEFLFYGKLIRDSGLDGPYVVSDIRGHRVNLAVDPEWFSQGDAGLKKIQAAKTTEPDRELILPYKDFFKTKFYDVKQFTSKIWDSNEKQRRIKELESMER
ncbi:hypothetical protein JWG45_04010 [Leptospira sp. 201903070]|uniref:Uncharacterized protein n=1 Tax=Leptospira ainlahdjerensis TaxID=2810033 RepID=A0ABS2U8P5_9LEPT|nr:hypothetical protein [Leptospira ainlahdjerensis]MBM9576313.1 hypothetical protein [Leptospira ainlahdjerensis]